MRTWAVARGETAEDRAELLGETVKGGQGQGKLPGRIARTEVVLVQGVDWTLRTGTEEARLGAPPLPASFQTLKARFQILEASFQILGVPCCWLPFGAASCKLGRRWKRRSTFALGCA